MLLVSGNDMVMGIWYLFGCARGQVAFWFGIWICLIFLRNEREIAGNSENQWKIESIIITVFSLLQCNFLTTVKIVAQTRENNFSEHFNKKIQLLRGVNLDLISMRSIHFPWILLSNYVSQQFDANDECGLISKQLCYEKFKIAAPNFSLIITDLL